MSSQKFWELPEALGTPRGSGSSPKFWELPEALGTPRGCGNSQRLWEFPCIILGNRYYRYLSDTIGYYRIL